MTWTIVWSLDNIRHDRICEYFTLAGTKRAFEVAGLHPKM